MLMKQWFILLGLIAGGMFLIVLGLAGVSWLRFGPLALFGHTGISLTLPYQAEDEPMGMRPLGEKEEVHPAGHPGIDFQWDYAAPLIATFDGTITSIAGAKDGNEPVLYLTLKQGEYTSTYKELDSVGPGIKVGTGLSQGDIVGYPHGHYFDDSGGHTNYQVHWEFGYDSFPGSVRLCPLAYFTPESLSRINGLWEKIKPTHHNPSGQMICNGG